MLLSFWGPWAIASVHLVEKNTGSAMNECRFTLNLQNISHFPLIIRGKCETPPHLPGSLTTAHKKPTTSKEMAALFPGQGKAAFTYVPSFSG